MKSESYQLKIVRLDEVCRLVTDGTHDSPKLQLTGVPFIKGKHISGGFVDFENCDFITGDDHRKAILRSKPERGDILFSNIGSVGDAAYIGTSREFSIKNVALFKPDYAKVDSRYLYYVVIGPVFRGELMSKRQGAAQPFFSLDMLRSHQVRYHSDIVTQRKIVAILSAYDDLIENNLRRIKILEEMAQNLYREWFVKFRFPGHQHARFTDSPLGRIPEGWEAVRFSDLLASGLGGDWGLDEPDAKENAPVFVIRGADFDNIVNGTALRTPRRFITPPSQAKRQLQAGDLLVENSINAKSRCVGTTLLITDGVLRRLSDPAIAASFCKVYRFKDPSLAPLAHLHMRRLYGEGRMAFYQNVAANGIGNFQSQRFLESEHLVFPADSQRQQERLGFLNDLTSSTLADQTFTLRRTRDLLLPRLISGEVEVSELDIAVSEESSA